MLSKEEKQKETTINSVAKETLNKGERFHEKQKQTKVLI